MKTFPKIVRFFFENLFNAAQYLSSGLYRLAYNYLPFLVGKTKKKLIAMLLALVMVLGLGATMALILLSIILVIVFYLSCQKHIIKGVAAGAVKG